MGKRPEKPIRIEGGPPVTAEQQARLNALAARPHCSKGKA